MMYLLRGSLPWQGLKVYGKEDKYQKILTKKKDTPVEELCKGFPSEFSDFLVHVKKLGYTDDPDYDLLKQYFDKIAKDNKFEYDNLYDWTKIESVKGDVKLSKNEGGDGNSNKAYKDDKEEKNLDEI
jgi:hypothetical protein